MSVSLVVCGSCVIHTSHDFSGIVSGSIGSWPVIGVYISMRVNRKVTHAHSCLPSDTVTERQALRENVYPCLYLYCKQRGYDFKMVDLRLGVSDPISEHNDSLELHLDTLRECQETDAANFFVSSWGKCVLC